MHGLWHVPQVPKSTSGTAPPVFVPILLLVANLRQKVYRCQITVSTTRHRGFAVLQHVPKELFARVYITDQLVQRPVDRADFLKEKIALQELAARMLSGPDAVLPRFVELAMRMTGGSSSGLSLYEPENSQFRWQHLCGALATFNGATTPRDHSPCGVTLDNAAPVLARHPELAYRWIADAKIELPEVLLVPLFIGGKEAAGTLWITADTDGHFTREHARVATELATLVGIALHVKRGEQHLQRALEVQETLTREMNHRIKNLFALTDVMIRQSLRHCATKEDMVEALSGRLHALASAHSLVLRDHEVEGNHIDLKKLVRAVVEPHDHGLQLAKSQVDFQGPALGCPNEIANPVALVVNELATNSVKYGALGAASGRVSISWENTDGVFRLTWKESGGPTVEAPTRTGFGNKLVETTVVRQFKGTVHYEWLPEGLAVAIQFRSSLFT